MRILIIGPAVRDMVMSQSLYRRLKLLHPTAQLDVLAPTWCRPVVERMPEVDEVIEMPIGHGVLNLKGRWQIAQQLKIKQYTHAFVLPNSAKSALIPWFVGISQRIGWKGEFRYGLLTDLRPNKKDFEYMVERYVALAHSQATMLDDVCLDNIEPPKLNVNKDNQYRCFEMYGIDASRPLIGICPGAEFGPAKRWPEVHFAALAAHFISQGKQVCLFGSGKDQPVTQAIVQALPKEAQGACFDLAGKTQLGDVVDLLAACQQVITNDSGLMHIAAAVDAPIVAIYGSTSLDTHRLCQIKRRFFTRNQLAVLVSNANVH